MRRLRSHRRSFALVDFLTGTIVFTGALVGFTALTKSKFDVIFAASAERAAQAKIEAELDRVRADTKPFKRPTGKKVDPQGFYRLSEKEFELSGVGPAVLIERARPLTTSKGSKRDMDVDFYEIQIRVEWDKGRQTLGYSTIRPAGGR